MRPALQKWSLIVNHDKLLTKSLLILFVWRQCFVYLKQHKAILFFCQIYLLWDFLPVKWIKSIFFIYIYYLLMSFVGKHFFEPWLKRSFRPKEICLIKSDLHFFHSWFICNLIDSKSLYNMHNYDSIRVFPNKVQNNMQLIFLL